MSVKRKLRMGMVGGGLDAFIGAVHRKAAALDGEIELVCGAFSSNPQKSKQAGEALYLDPERVYDSFGSMIAAEKKLPVGERMDFVSIVTPNHLHFAPAKEALENGFHVMIDKPITLSVAEAKNLKTILDKTGLVLAVSHAYAGYPMVKEARHLVKTGKIGKVRKIYVEYPQGWLATPIEKTGQKQAGWRTDPKKSGAGGAIGDIGTHAAHLAEYITDLSITEICADLNAVIKGRLLDDDGQMLLRFRNGASGTLVATQVAAGEENNLKIKVYGEKGGLEWRQEEPNSLVVRHLDEPKQIYRTGMGYVCEAARKNTRVPSGHPEGYLEAFANIYLAFASGVRDHKPGKRISGKKYDFPDIEDGVKGMEFVDAVVKSSKSKQKWIKL